MLPPPPSFPFLWLIYDERKSNFFLLVPPPLVLVLVVLLLLLKIQWIVQDVHPSLTSSLEVVVVLHALEFLHLLILPSVHQFFLFFFHDENFVEFF